MDCNKTIDFLLERKRLCDSQHDGVNPCDECPLENICDEQSNAEIIKSAISRLQKWSNKHPKKTYAQDFLEKFPNARIGDDGLPEVCRMEVYGTRCLSMTGDMCTMCWCEPMEK
jgi:hypothetical protein